jgi:hypothetical protein
MYSDIVRFSPASRVIGAIMGHPLTVLAVFCAIGLLASIGAVVYGEVPPVGPDVVGP